MSFFRSWTRRPVAAAMALAVLVAFALVALMDARLGPSGGEGRVAYAVIINYYGVDAGRIERDVTRPLENAAASIPGIDEMQSTSEFGKSRVTVTLSAAADKNEVYLQLRDVVERVYGAFPPSVQKPVIVSSTGERRPVFIASFSSDRVGPAALGELVEKEVKAAFERIDGTGEIDVGGGEIREIHVAVKPERAAAAGLSLPDVARVINDEHALAPVGELRNSVSGSSLVIRGTFTSLDQLKTLTLAVPGSGPQRLADLADVGYAAREKESVSRINGEEQPTVYIQSSGSANLVSLSRLLREEAARWKQRGLEPDIILDDGKTIEDSIGRVFNAIVAGVALVVVLVAISSGSLRRIVVLSALMPLVCLLTLGLLSLLGVSVDTFVLAGLAVGIGNVVDGAIVLTEACASKRETGLEEHRLLSLKEVIPPLLSSVLTTIVVLVPLFFLSDIAEGIRSVTISIGLLMALSLLITVIFIPPFYFLKQRDRKSKPRKMRRLKLPAFLSVRRFRRLLCASTLFVMKRPKLFLAGFSGVLALGVAALLAMGKDLSGIREDGVLSAHLEFESGDAVETCDARAALLSNALRKIDGVERVETNARFGSAEMTVRFDPARLKREDLAAALRNEGRKIPRGFVYLPDSGTPAGKKIEVAVLGDDNEVLRDSASRAASRLGAESWVDQVVLHFKEGPPTLVFGVDREKLASCGLSTAQIADELRWSLHGPVALKWIERDREIDLRVMAERAAVASLAALRRLTFRPPQGRPVALDELGTFTERREESKIYRKNRQRAVFFTVHTKDLDLDAAVRNVWRSLGDVPLPQGYAFELDKSASRLAGQFKTMWLVLALAVVLIYMILAAQSESLTSPLLVCATAPLSLAFPLLVLSAIGQPLTTPVLIGLVILSGMVVNNSLLIADLVRENAAKERLAYTPRAVARPVLFALRRRIRDLLLTSATTVFGALPLLVVGGSGMLSSLSFIAFWGILGSLVVTLFFLPAFIVTFPRLLKSYSAGPREQDTGVCRARSASRKESKLSWITGKLCGFVDERLFRLRESTAGCCELPQSDRNTSVNRQTGRIRPQQRRRGNRGKCD
ncbi:MAG: efflux RND transporter permease subunit [Spirochaetales bacterium]|nr:efflux RND transporter permease subunit [Spirochaetales bacterium]